MRFADVPRALPTAADGWKIKGLLKAACGRRRATGPTKPRPVRSGIEREWGFAERQEISDG